MKLGNTLKKFEGIDTTILLVSLSIIIVIIVLAVKNSNKEDFENKEISSNTELYSRGPAGAAGPDGEPKPNININDVYSDGKTNIMEKLVEKDIIIKEEHTDTNRNKIVKYFPLGTINMKTVIDTDKLTITDMDKNYFNVSYNKKAKSSYIKIKYTITLTGNNKVGNQFTIFSKKKNEDGGDIEYQISAKHSMAGVNSEGAWYLSVPKSINILGIDTYTSDNLEKNYFVRIGFGDGEPKIGFNESNHAEYNIKGYLSSSCTIEEIVLPKDTDTTLSKFIKSNQ